MSILRQDWTIRKGNTGTVENAEGLVFEFCQNDEQGNEVPQDLTGVSFYFFTAFHNSERLQSNTQDIENQILVDLTAARATIPISLEWSRFVDCPGQLNYELESRTSTSQRTRIVGTLYFEKGLNDD